MQWRWILAALLATGVQAFFSDPIRLRTASGSPVASWAVPAKMTSELTISDRVCRMSGAAIPKRFTARADNTIMAELNGLQLCLEASGDKSGDVVRASRCTGAPTQLWKFLPWGHGPQGRIQLTNTEKCVKCIDDSNRRAGLHEAAFELGECDHQITEFWKLEEQIPLPTRGLSPHRASSSYVRDALIGLISVVSLGALSITAWQHLQFSQEKIHQVVYCGNMSCAVDQGGVSLEAPLTMYQWPASRTPRLSEASFQRKSPDGASLFYSMPFQGALKDDKERQNFVAPLVNHAQPSVLDRPRVAREVAQVDKLEGSNRHIDVGGVQELDPVAEAEREKRKKKMDEFKVNVGEAIDSLNSDIPRIFEYQPNWGIYTNDLELDLEKTHPALLALLRTMMPVKDAKVEGLFNNVKMLQYLHDFRKHLVSWEEVKVRTHFSIDTYTGEQVLKSRWSAQIGMKTFSNVLRWGNFPETQLVTVDAVSIFFLTPEGRIHRHVIDDVEITPPITSQSVEDLLWAMGQYRGAYGPAVA